MGWQRSLYGALIIHLSMKDGYYDVWKSLPQSLYRARRALAAEGVHERPDGLYDSNLSITSITSEYQWLWARVPGAWPWSAHQHIHYWRTLVIGVPGLCRHVKPNLRMRTLFFNQIHSFCLPISITRPECTFCSLFHFFVYILLPQELLIPTTYEFDSLFL